jgi:acyl-[acyl-carrier-protein] desaturase
MRMQRSCRPLPGAFSPPAVTKAVLHVEEQRVHRGGVVLHHEQILVPVVLRQWGADKISGLSGEGAAAQERLMKRLATSEKVARRFAEKRDAALANA